jgi:predicted DNA-binding transcriptional regulator AlpA
MAERLQRLFRLKDLPAFTGLRRTTIIELVEKNEFPEAVPLTDGGRAKGWLEADLINWQQARIAAREVK